MKAHISQIVKQIWLLYFMTVSMVLASPRHNILPLVPIQAFVSLHLRASTHIITFAHTIRPATNSHLSLSLFFILSTYSYFITYAYKAKLNATDTITHNNSFTNPRSLCKSEHTYLQRLNHRLAFS